MKRQFATRTILYDYSDDRRDGGNGGKPYYDRRRSSTSGGGSGDIKSKRQERVAQIVKTELSQIIHSGLIKGTNVEYLDDTLRTRISVVNTDISPDLRQARISISIRPIPRSQQQIVNDDNDDDGEDYEDEEEDDFEDADENDLDDEVDDNEGIIDELDEALDDVEEEEDVDGTNQLQKAIQQRTRSNGSTGTNSSPAVDRRRAFAWLVRNTKSIRYTLAQRMSHMKSCPELTFVQVDVSAAVDVMYLIDKLSKTDGKYKRTNLDLFHQDDIASGIIGGLDFDAVDDDDDDDDDDEEDWDINDAFLKTK